MGRIELFLWGTPRILQDGNPLEFDTRKATALLAYLALNPDGFTRDALAAFFWPDYDQEHGRAALRRTLSTLRGALKSENELLESGRDWVSLRHTPHLWVDIEAFRMEKAAAAACEENGKSALTQCLERYKKAVDLHRGEFMAGFSLRDSPDFDDWQSYQNEILRGEISTVLDMLVTLLTQAGNFEDAIRYTLRWLSLDNLHEEAHRQLMRLYCWAGQRAAALHQFQECARILDRELGVTPLEKTVELYQQIVENRLPPPMQVQNFQSPASTSIPSSRRDLWRAQPNLQGEPGMEEISPAGEYPLVGREIELEVLFNFYEQSIKRGRVIVLQGEPGIGKTRLAEEFLQRTRNGGSKVISTRCYEGQMGLAYAPVIDGLRGLISNPDIRQQIREVPNEWLVECSRILPELRNLAPGLSAPVPIEGPWAQGLFFEGLRQLTLRASKGSAPSIFFIDDLQWADHGTIEFLAYISRRIPEDPVLILVTIRGEDGARYPLLNSLINDALRLNYGATVRINRLDREAVNKLVHSRFPESEKLPADLGNRLFEEAEGLPFFITEYLDTVRSHGTWMERNWPVPETVRDLIHSRLSTVDETGGQLLATAAVIGRGFDYEILLNASGRSESETISGLEQLVSQGIIRENRIENQVNPVYGFSHEKIRTLVYEETLAARRKLLHRRVADALIGSGRRATHTQAGLIANHFLLAGENNKAAEFFNLAGDQAAAIYANTQSLAHYQSALELGYPDQAELNTKIGDLYTLIGDYPEAIAHYQAAVAASPGECLPDVEHKLGNVYDRRGEWEQAEQYFQSAYQELLNDDLAYTQIAHLLADWSRLTIHRGDLSKAQELARQVLTYSEPAGEQNASAQAHNVLGMAARSAQEYDLAIYHLQRSLEYAQAASDPHARVAALNNLALVYRDCGRLQEAIPMTQAALELCIQLGDRHRQAALLNNLADLYHESGYPDQSMDHLKKAVVIFSEIGLESGSLVPSPWMLVEW